MDRDQTTSDQKGDQAQVHVRGLGVAPDEVPVVPDCDQDPVASALTGDALDVDDGVESGDPGDHVQP